MLCLFSGSAYGGPFWRLVEPFFSFLTTEDIAYLSQQVLPDDSAASRSVEGDESRKFKVLYCASKITPIHYCTNKNLLFW
jgi:hypothetical protein